MIPIKLIYENISLNERADDKRRREITRQYFKIILDNLENVPSFFDDNGGIFDFSNAIGIKLIFIEYPKHLKIIASYFHKNHTIYINISNEQIYNLFYEKKYRELLIKIEPTIIHELTHYLDFERHMATSYGHPDIRDLEQINTPKEFEAYFQAQAHVWDKDLEMVKKTDNPLEEFYKTFGYTAKQFIDKFWEKMKVSSEDFVKVILGSDKYRFKWMKRLYQVYFELKGELK
jgi:hypothetical protein